MGIPDLSFYVNVKSDLDFAQFRAWLRPELESLGIVWLGEKNVGEATNNMIEFGENDFYDARLTQEGDEFHFPYFVQVSSIKSSDITIEDFIAQLAFARTLLQKLQAKSFDVKVNAEFEDSL